MSFIQKGKQIPNPVFMKLAIGIGKKISRALLKMFGVVDFLRN